jgi:hypothetical protein
MLGDMIDSGLATGLIVAVAGGLVQLWIWRIRGRTAERLKGLDVSSTRDGRALDAESAAFGYLQKALDDARKEIDALEATVTSIRRSHDAETGALKLDLAREQQHKNEALLDAFNTRTLWQAAALKFDVDTGSLRAELIAVHWRERQARAYIAQIRAAYPDAPAPPFWIDDDRTDDADDVRLLPPRPEGD